MILSERGASNRSYPGYAMRTALVCLVQYLSLVSRFRRASTSSWNS